jgi:hypothetical protein
VQDASISPEDGWHDAAMKISATISYPDGTSPAQVYELATDTEFRGEVCEATHALDYDVSVDELGDDTAKVVVCRTMPADVPDFIKKMIGEKVDVVQTEEWGAPDGNGQRAADIVLQIKGQPATMKGTAAIIASDAGVVMQIDGDLKVSIPFIGKKVEGEIAKGIYAAVDKEQETAAKHLP